MTVPKPLHLALTAIVALGPLVASGALAQEASDGGAKKEGEAEKRPPYRGSFFFWDNTVSAETVGVGDDVQSSNPTYTMGFGTKARYYLSDEPGSRLSLRGDIGLYRELTNSDSTTDRGETSFSDAELALDYTRRIWGASDADGVMLGVRPLTLVLPTSKASWSSGRYFAPGVVVGLTHVTPLLKGRFEPELGSSASLAVGYKRWFARATVPTNPSLQLERLTPDGRTVPGDQLSGSSLTRDQLSFLARWSLGIGKRVSLSTDFGLQPSWKYDVADEVEVCGVIDTGCATVGVSEDDSRYVLRTLFGVELGVELVTSLSLAVGYSNLANQLGPDGRRRGMFYSPDASFFAALAFTPDELLSPPKQSARASTAAGTF